MLFRSNDCIDLMTHLLRSGLFPDEHGYQNATDAVEYACRKGTKRGLKVLIEHGANLKGAILHAANRRKFDTVRFLIEHGAELEEGVLQRPVAKGRMDLVRMLLEYGADAGELNSRALMSAIRIEHTDMFELLLQNGAKLDDDVGNECAVIARKLGLDSMLTLLAGHGVHVSDT